MKMTEITQSDDALLKHWLATRSEAAFRALVGRYAGLVHMAAMRTCGDASLADEASQNTFITLAEKAGTLASRKSLAGWLHLTAVMQAKNLHRKQLRDSRKIERFHLQMDPPTPEQAAIDWGRLSPLLDEALSTLPAKDREALLLRFYRSLSIQDVAATLGIAHAAAQKRVNRATERLRRIFERKGVRTSGSLGAVMAAGFRTDAQAAPALIDTLTSKALAASAAGTTATLTTTTIILMTKTTTTAITDTGRGSVRLTHPHHHHHSASSASHSSGLPLSIAALLHTLRVVFISHMHADHHLGLLSVMAARRVAFGGGGGDSVWGGGGGSSSNSVCVCVYMCACVGE